MKPAPFRYHRPATVEEAARLLAELGEDAKVLAGGQSLVPLMNFRLASPDHLVDLNGVAGLGDLAIGGDAVDVGATVRTARLVDDPALPAAHPLLAAAAGWVAHPVIRNRGTVCGSLAHADPAAEMPAVLALLGGSVAAVSWRGGGLARRRVAADELFVGPFETTLAVDELVVAATFPRLAPGTGWAMDELAMRHGDYALAGVVLTVTVEGDGTPTAGRAAYLSCAPTPVVVDLGAALAGPDHALYDLVAGALDPTGDIHATADYRRHLAATLTVRSFGPALDRARAGSDGAGSRGPVIGMGGSPGATSSTAPAPDAAQRAPATPAGTGSPGTASGDGASTEVHEVVLAVNGVTRAARVPARRLLSDVLRHDLGLTGTHVGCEHGVCGACTVLVDGEPVRSCLTFAVMVDGAEVTTVEGLAGSEGELGPVQRAFRECHGLQCGFCTPGFLLLTTDLLARTPDPTDDDITDALGGNLCRCTGYVNIVRSVRRAAELAAVAAGGPEPVETADAHGAAGASRPEQAEPAEPVETAEAADAVDAVDAGEAGA